MAGGIDWFRWHHGSVTDPKFQLVAKKAGARLGDVITVWAFVLEAASSNAERGTIGPLDFETLDFLLGADEGTAARIIDAMKQRGLIVGAQIGQWDKRQPKREREDDGSSDRKRAQRERDAAMKNVTPSNPLLELVTPCHATSHQKTPRGEESREDIKEEPSGSCRLASPPDQQAACPQDEIIALYHEKLPELPAVKLKTESRAKAMRGFWKWVLTSKKSNGQPRATGKDQALTWIASYFERANGNDFLMGRQPSGRGHENWRADFDFLLTEKGKKHVIEKTEETA